MPDLPDLDPQISTWLHAAPPVDIDFGDIAAIRAMSEAYMRETGGPAPRFNDDRVSLTSRTIAGVDTLIWSPIAPPTTPAYVVAAHGGGFVVGSALGAERVAVPLAAEHGVTTISVEYRLAPEHRAPAALDDMTAVLAAIAAENPASRIAVHGSSAGACLAAGAALWARDHGISLAGQSLSCPALDDRVIDDVWSPTWTPAATAWMWRHYLGEAAPPDYCVPARHDDLAGLAPAHLVIASHDTLRSQGLAYADRLHAAGVDTTVLDMPGTVHGFDGLLPDSAPARAAIDAQVRTLAGWATGAKAEPSEH